MGTWFSLAKATPRDKQNRLRVSPAARYTARTMGAITVDQVESRLKLVRCAICKASDFSIDRRTMQPDGEWRAACNKCRYSFPVHTDMAFYERTQPDIPYVLKAIPCPFCQQQGVSLDFRIVLSVREAYY